MAVPIAVIDVRHVYLMECKSGVPSYLVPHSSDEHQTRCDSALEDS